MSERLYDRMYDQNSELIYDKIHNLRSNVFDDASHVLAFETLSEVALCYFARPQILPEIAQVTSVIQNEIDA